MGIYSFDSLFLSVVLVFFSTLSLEESVKAMSLSAEEDDIPWDTLRDNRDLTVFTNWDPKERYRGLFCLQKKEKKRNVTNSLSFLFLSQTVN